MSSGAHLHVIGPWQHSSINELSQWWQAVATRVRFDRLEIWTSDLPLQKRTSYRATNNWPGQASSRFYDVSNIAWPTNSKALSKKLLS